MLSLNIPNNIFQEILTQAKVCDPLEACGILAGKDDRVEKCYKMTNADQSETHFTMVPQEQFTVIKDIRAAGLKMKAIYHSHPATPARLSAEDIRLAVTPDVIYVIVSLALDEPVVKGFLIENGNVTQVAVKVSKTERSCDS